MAWTDPVDIYCERLDPSFWAEPVNALTNGAFLIAALTVLAQAPPEARRDPMAMVLVGIMFLIGLGSFAFHTLATKGSALLDVLPITLFIHLYFYIALRRFLGCGVTLSAALTFSFFILGLAVDRVGGGALNGSIGYLPALCALAGMALAVLKAGTPEARRAHVAKKLFGIAGLFALSLTFRTVDNVVCAGFPLGTHFLWHVLNATVLYFLIRLLSGLAAPVSRRFAS